MAYNTRFGNQYADKVYAEHPIALWPLDEDVYYLSLITDNDRYFSNWNLTNATYHDIAYPSLPDTPSPFDSSIYSTITSNTNNEVLVTAISDETFTPAGISIDITTFCVNFWLYQRPTYIKWFKVGYQYTHSTLGTQTVLSDEILPAASASWMNFNNIYTIPDNWTGAIKLIIQISFADSTGEGDDARSVIMSGLSVGQDSETTCFVSLGSTGNLIPSEIGFGNVYGIPADQYGLQSDIGYYLIRNNRLLARNDGFPIIYGSNHATKIYSSGTPLPSLIFPGKGMLNESGRNKQYTLEMWIKLDPLTTTARRIAGPISSNDGIWVKEGFITLVVGNEIASHCVAEWYRPMLMHVVMKENNVVMLINGEKVIDIPIDRKTIDLPNTRDWWGIYSYSSISMFEVDSISIYPYSISDLVAKRRFVYGLGTPSIQTINNDFLGTPVTVDFSTAEYSTNTIYPDIARWDAGYFNNLNATKNYISVPNYQLPIINIAGRNLDEWYSNNYIVNTLEYPDRNHPNFVTFRPNIDYDEDGNPVAWNPDGINYTGQSYLNFKSLNILNDALAAVYGVFEVEQDLDISRTLMSFANITNGTTFDINVINDQIKYLINGNEIYSQIFTIGAESLVGLNFEVAGVEFGYEVSQFFSSPSSIQLYIGGNGSNTFEGKIYVVGFCNQSNYQKIQQQYTNNEIFLSNGLTNVINYELIIDHIASYTLVPEYEYNKLYLDISVSSEWEEYYPLNQFASYVRDSAGNPYYDLDMLQLNLGYASVSSTDVWKYTELRNEFNGLTYADLKDSVYETYFALKKRNTVGTAINVADSSLQAYITFQSLVDGANAPLSSFPYTKNIIENSVIDADLENTVSNPEKAYQTKFVFNDNTIVYPPKSKNFEEYAMVVHLVINQRSILKNPLKIRNFEIASKNLNYASDADDQSQRNYIGTKFGTKIYPEIDLFGQSDYKSKNPYLLYKTSTPYLYTTKKSGIKVINQNSISDPTTIKQYRVSIPVNQNGSYDFNIGALSFFLLGDLPDIANEIPFIEIKHKGGIIAIVINKDSTGTKIIAYDKNETIFLDGGNSFTTSFSDLLDGEYSGSNASSFINVTIASRSDSPVENMYTISFLQSSLNIDTINDTITYPNPHGYSTGTQIVYTSQDPVGGLVNEGLYFVKVISDLIIALYHTKEDALADTNRIDLYGIPTGTGATTEYQYVTISGFDFYQNGRYVKSPSIKNDEWNYVGITFPTGLDFSEFYDGEINVFGGFTFNNLSYYLSDGLGIKTDVTVRVWSEILNENDIVAATGDGTYVTYTTNAEHGLSDGQYIRISGITPSSLNIGGDNFMAMVDTVIDDFSFKVANSSTDTYVSGGISRYIWNEWIDVPWSDAYVLGQTTSYVSSPADIYSAYTGTNRDIVDDGLGMSFAQVETVAFTDTSWTVYSGKPA